MLCESVPRAAGGFDLVLSLRDVTIEREICRAVPGSDEQATEWRQLYEAYGFSEPRRA